MKKSIFVAVLLLAAITYSCTTSEEPFQKDSTSTMCDLVLVNDGSIVYEPSVNVDDFILDDEDLPDTKTVLTISSTEGATFKFADNDMLGIFPYTVSGAPQARFTLKSRTATSCVFNGNGFALTAGTGYAAYYPFNPADGLSSTSVPVNYTGQTQASVDGSTFNIGSADYLLSHATPVDNSCNFRMSHIGSLVVLYVTVLDTNTYTELSLCSDNASFVTGGNLNVGQPFNTSTTPASGIVLSNTTTSNTVSLALGSGNGIVLSAGQTYTFCMMVYPVDLSGSLVTVKLKDSAGKYHRAVTPDMSLTLKQGYAYRFYPVISQTNLSSIDGTADGITNTSNSYIIDTDDINPDGYKFYTGLAGNGKEVDWASIGFADGEGEAYPTGGGCDLSGNGVEITLNQNNCVSNVFFSGDWIYFKATGNKGNAKLTLTNNGTKVWTWHIWCTSQPNTINITSKTSGKTYAVMDRNLGAYDEINYYSEQGCGLYYPFGSPIGFTVAEYTNGDEGGYRMIDAYALHPEKPFLKYAGNYMTFNSWGADNYNLPWCLIWGGGSFYNYHNFESKLGDAHTKTMYDPCPPGYKVMTYDVLDGYANDDAGANGSYYGVSISGTNGTLFLPYNGTIYKGGIRTMSVTLWNTAYTVETRGWKVNLWTSRYWQNLCPTAYSIQMKVDNAKYENDTMNGGIKQDGGEDCLSIGHGVRCMVGW
ncbi:MAG: hypothetical protein J5801_03725 [Bacteroidales bacterium]|nr:hypothetical protein [Bacteroidales bacterium]